MKEREIYANLRTVVPFFVRIDGRNFRRALSSLNFERPYDVTFAKAMATASEMLLRDSGLGARFVFAFSDEINTFFCEAPFRGRVEKLDSIAASFVASALTLALAPSTPLAFDARTIPMRRGDVTPYLVWRQSEAWRNHVHAYGYYSLRQSGCDAHEAHEKLYRMTSSDIHELLFHQGTNLAKTPAWQRRGILIYKKAYEKKGYDGVTGRTIEAQRSKIVQDWNVPRFTSPEGRQMIEALVDVADINKY
ncbi:MAG: tRNA(His) guanylyltransferase Thg1 family protein [Halobacteriota archaeon]